MQGELGANDQPGGSYLAYGLRIRSELPWPTTTSWERPADEPDVTISFGQVPEDLGKGFAEGMAHQVSGDRFLFAVKSVARYLVKGGREIIVQPEADDQEDEIRAYLLGPVFGVLLHQRGFMVLHGSAVSTEHGAAVFVGRAGMGKSTLAAAFQRRGYGVLVDDVCAVNLNVAGRAVVYPGMAQLKLWRESADALGYDVTATPRVQRKYDKFWLPPPDSADPRPLPLKAVYALADDEGGSFRVEALPFHLRVQTLLRNTYRAYYLPEMALQVQQFRLATSLARRTAVKTVYRPRDLGQLARLVSYLEQDIAFAPDARR